VELRIGGAMRGNAATGSAHGGVTWTASRDGAALSGTYNSPRGAGTWTARPVPGQD
jgi:hypothetical protein